MPVYHKARRIRFLQQGIERGGTSAAGTLRARPDFGQVVLQHTMAQHQCACGGFQRPHFGQTFDEPDRVLGGVFTQMGILHMAHPILQKPAVVVPCHRQYLSCPQQITTGV